MAANINPTHNQEHHDHQPQKLPQVLVYKPPPIFPLLETHFPGKFQFLKAWESPELSLNQFFAAQGRSVQAILCASDSPVTSAVLDQLPAVRLVVSASAGLNHIDLSECRRRGVLVTSAGDTLSEDGADMAVGLLIDVLREVSAADRFVRQGFWAVQGDYPLRSKLGGKRIGIVGLGRIGIQIAKRLEAFGCTISYNSRKQKPNIPYPYYSNISELASHVDILIVCCALTDQTRHMINKEVMSELGKRGIIINVGRGGIIDEQEMVKCLVKGEIAGAGLDVFENEPYVAKELFELDNVVLSPHRAVFTSESFMALCELVVGNLEAFFSDKPLLSLVTDE